MTPGRFQRALALGAVAALGGCAGVHYDVKADSARYPISFSPALPDGAGQILYPGEGLQAVGDFELQRTRWGAFYGAMRSDYDMSNDINDAVRARGGEGVINLSITNTNCALNMFFPLTILPFFPGCANLEIKGTVVRRAASRPIALVGR
jgi:hypothetical protein